MSYSLIRYIGTFRHNFDVNVKTQIISDSNSTKWENIAILLYYHGLIIKQWKDIRLTLNFLQKNVYGIWHSIVLNVCGAYDEL